MGCDGVSAEIVPIVLFSLHMDFPVVLSQVTYLDELRLSTFKSCADGQSHGRFLSDPLWADMMQPDCSQSLVL